MKFTGVLIFLISLGLAANLEAGGFSLSGSHESGFAGDSVTASLTMDNVDPARGFSLGLDHVSSIVTLTGIDQGAAVMATNGGSGAEFFFTDTNPINGPGGIVGCVISLSAPIEDIPAGTNQEVAQFNYDIGAGAAAGAVSDLGFNSTMGNPPVDVVISVAGTSIFPTTFDGSVTVLVPAVTNLTCALTDICTCEFQMNWTNNGSYDSIEIYEDGGLVTTLGGGATSYTHNLAGPGTNTLGVVAVAGGISSSETTCTADCGVVIPPASPENLSCTVDANGLVTVTWTNPETYNGIDVLLDGSVVQSLAGTATSADVQLPDFGSFEICLQGDAPPCALPFSEVCCNVDYAQMGDTFLRGDSDGDGAFNGVVDGVHLLSFAFSGGPPPPCMEAADVDGDGGFNGVVDGVFLLTHAFSGGPPPPAPYPACGLDPDPGTSLGCAPNACP